MKTMRTKFQSIRVLDFIISIFQPKYKIASNLFRFVSFLFFSNNIAIDFDLLTQGTKINNSSFF